MNTVSFHALALPGSMHWPRPYVRIKGIDGTCLSWTVVTLIARHFSTPVPGAIQCSSSMPLTFTRGFLHQLFHWHLQDLHTYKCECVLVAGWSSLPFTYMWLYAELWLKDGRRIYQQLSSSRCIIHICTCFPPSSHVVPGSLQKPGGVGTVQLRHSCKDHQVLPRDSCDCCKSKTFLIFIIRYILWIHTWSVHMENWLIIFFFI